MRIFICAAIVTITSMASASENLYVCSSISAKIHLYNDQPVTTHKSIDGKCTFSVSDLPNSNLLVELKDGAQEVSFETAAKIPKDTSIKSESYLALWNSLEKLEIEVFDDLKKVQVTLTVEKQELSCEFEKKWFWGSDFPQDIDALNAKPK